MRHSCGPIDSSELPWREINEDVSFKLLNGNREEGAHTVILRSVTREPNLPRGQHHPADEEFFCLEGDFTFDGSTWLKSNSYAFFPAHFVHGTKVHVRGGYELYLRISGTNQILWEDAPKQDQPYLVNGYESDDFAVQIENALERLIAPLSTHEDGVQAVKKIGLHAHPVSEAGSTLVAVGDCKAQVEFRSLELLEIFVLSGTFVTKTGKSIGQGAYLCDVAKNAEISLGCTCNGVVMVSHEGGLDVLKADARS